jgi:hypothetical protein
MKSDKGTSGKICGYVKIAELLDNKDKTLILVIVI